MPALIFAILAIFVVVAIFVLTEQPADITTSESDLVNKLLAGLFGGVPLIYNSEKQLWLGIDIRHWAHTVEFWLLGIFVALSALFALKPDLLATGVTSLVICFSCSLFDQCHKMFVPVRHFDWFDLVMDALGYGIAISTVSLISGMLSLT